MTLDFRAAKISSCVDGGMSDPVKHAQTGREDPVSVSRFFDILYC